MPRCHLSRPGDRFFTHIAEKRPAGGWRRAAHSTPGRPPGCWARRGRNDEGTKSQDLQPQPPTRSGKPVRSIPGNRGQPCWDGFPISVPPPQAGDCSCNGVVPFAKPPPETHGRCGDKHLVYFRIADIASPNERVIEGGGGGGGTGCIHGGRVRGGKNKRESRWLARRQRSLSLSPSLSLSVYFPLCC